MKVSIKKKYENLVADNAKLVSYVKGFLQTLHGLHTVVASTLPAFGKEGETYEVSKTPPNVFFVKDMITQVMSGNSLGYETCLEVKNGALYVVYRKKAEVPYELRYL